MPLARASVARGSLASFASVTPALALLVAWLAVGIATTSLFGWLMLGEDVTWTAAGGAVLIVAGCWIATTGVRSEPAAV